MCDHIMPMRILTALKHTSAFYCAQVCGFGFSRRNLYKMEAMNLFSEERHSVCRRHLNWNQPITSSVTYLTLQTYWHNKQTDRQPCTDYEFLHRDLNFTKSVSYMWMYLQTLNCFISDYENLFNAKFVAIQWESRPQSWYGICEVKKARDADSR
jgi:hypothetical protein